jgi:putative tricarboxylic transport membrane protein
MDLLNHIILGLSVALSPANLLYCFLGVILGTLVGVLPGLGPTAGLAILIPVTAGLAPATSLIMLAGLYYGAMYGGSTTTILLNVPGEAASVVTALDGYQMARKGRAGAALGIAAISSFIAGTISTALLMFVAPPMAELGLLFGPPEYFALMVLGMSILISISGKSLLKGSISALLGMLIAMVGIDPMTGVARFTYGSTNLLGGIDYLSVIVGLFAISEMLLSLEGSLRSIYEGSLSSVFPSLSDLKRCVGSFLRGSFLGFLIGSIPGGNPTIAAFVSYDLEKKLAKNPQEFGTGAIEGVASPEAANNAAAQAGLVPLLTLGIPGGPTIAVLMGAFLIQGLTPGPMLFKNQPDIVWGLIMSMYIGNVMLLVLNLPLVGVWAKIARVPYRIIAPIILVISVLGAYSISNNMFDVWLMFLFGILGYFMKKIELPHAPVVLALVLAPMIENALRQSLTMSKGSLLILVSRPIPLFLFVLSVFSVIVSLYSRMKKSSKAEALFQASEEED